MLENTGKKLLILVMMTCLGACSALMPTVRVKVETDCVWFEDQTFSQDTIQILTKMKPWPDHLNEDLNKVRQNNDLAKKHCKE